MGRIENYQRLCFNTISQVKTTQNFQLQQTTQSTEYYRWFKFFYTLNQHYKN